jgi:GntR family transcriptional regulator, transcriptional repressor for pyruvate dehydrogenase complex
VNRVTIRSALGRLEAEHLLDVRQGSGYCVRDYRRTGGPDLIATLATLANTAKDRAVIVRDLLAVRRQLARATLERLVESADETSLREVEAAIDRLAAAADANAPVAQLAAADLEVVAALVAATGSAVLQLCFNPVAALLRELPILQEAIYRDPHSNVAAFRTVLELVRKRSLPGAELAIELLAERDHATVQELAARKSPKNSPKTSPRKSR